MLKKIFLISINLMFLISFNLNYLIIKKEIFAQEYQQLPTPTYTLFKPSEEKTEENIVEKFKTITIITDTDCGKIGQKCCGKLYDKNFNNITNQLQGVFSNLLFIQSLSSLFISALPPLISFLINQIIPLQNEIIKITDKIIPLNIQTSGYCIQGSPSNQYNINECTCVEAKNLKAANLCSMISNNDEKIKCYENCMKDGKGVWTSLGCFSSDLSTLIKEKIFGYAIGLAGGFSFLCIIYSSFLIQSSNGSNEKIKKAQELLTSCIMGLILIIFSVFILRLIGVNILNIPFIR